MGLFEDIGNAIKTDRGIKALSGIVAAIAAPEGYAAQSGFAATQEVGRVQQLAKENQQKQEQLMLEKNKEANQTIYQGKLIDDATKNTAIKQQEANTDAAYKSRYLDIMAGKEAAKDVGGKLPDAIKKDVEMTMTKMDKEGWGSSEARADYANALIASKYGAPTPKSGHGILPGGAISFTPKYDTITQKSKDGKVTKIKIKIGQTKQVPNGDMYIYIGNDQWSIMK